MQLKIDLSFLTPFYHPQFRTFVICMGKALSQNFIDRHLRDGKGKREREEGKFRGVPNRVILPRTDTSLFVEVRSGRITTEAFLYEQ